MFVKPKRLQHIIFFKVWLLSIAIFCIKKYCNTKCNSLLNIQQVLQYGYSTFGRNYGEVLQYNTFYDNCHINNPANTIAADFPLFQVFLECLLPDFYWSSFSPIYAVHISVAILTIAVTFCGTVVCTTY